MGFFFDRRQVIRLSFVVTCTVFVSSPLITGGWANRSMWTVCGAVVQWNRG